MQRDHFRRYAGTAQEATAPEGPDEVCPPVGLAHLLGDSDVSLSELYLHLICFVFFVCF